MITEKQKHMKDTKGKEIARHKYIHTIESHFVNSSKSKNAQSVLLEVMVITFRKAAGALQVLIASWQHCFLVYMVGT